MLTENKTTEFKREYVADIRKTAIAFANTDGGTLYIGVNDDGSVAGLSDAEDTALRVMNAIRDAVRPDLTLFAECGPAKMDNKPVVILKVQRGTARPYYLAGKGIRPEGVFVRQGASTVPATETAILNMIRETSGDCFEEALSLNQRLSFTEASAVFSRKAVPFTEAQKRTLGLMREDGTYTNLALLLSDQCVHTLRLAVFEGSVKTVFKDRCELSGSLLRQLEEAYAYIDRYNRTRAEYRGLDRIDMRDYPEAAIRESLANAVVHRDYAYSGSTLISIFDDRMEFVNLGGLVKGISYEDILLGVSQLRNPKLANVFYRLHLIEAYGTGILKIKDSYDGYAMKPRIEVSNNAFKVTLPNTNEKWKMESGKWKIGEDSAAIVGGTVDGLEPKMSVFPFGRTREGAVLQMLGKREFITRREVQEALGISQATAILLLRSMVEEGLLAKEGQGKQMRYKIMEN